MKHNDVDRANQLTSMIAERENLQERPTPSKFRIDISNLSGKIAVDIDDTLSSFEADMRQALAKTHGLSFKEALERYPSNPPEGIASWFGGGPDGEKASYKAYQEMEAAGLLYSHQPMREGAADTVNWLYKETNGNLVFLTARPEPFKRVSSWWLQKRLGVSFTPDVRHSHKKSEVEDFALLIDDSVPHVKEVTAPDAPFGPRPTIFMTRPRTAGKVEETALTPHAWSWRDVRRILTVSTEKE